VTKHYPLTGDPDCPRCRADGNRPKGCITRIVAERGEEYLHENREQLSETEYAVMLACFRIARANHNMFRVYLPVREVMELAGTKRTATHKAMQALIARRWLLLLDAGNYRARTSGEFHPLPTVTSTWWGSSQPREIPDMDPPEPFKPAVIGRPRKSRTEPDEVRAEDARTSDDLRDGRAGVSGKSRTANEKVADSVVPGTRVTVNGEERSDDHPLSREIIASPRASADSRDRDKEVILSPRLFEPTDGKSRTEPTGQESRGQTEVLPRPWPSLAWAHHEQGPCARCWEPCHRYGEGAATLCAACMGDSRACP